MCGPLCTNVFSRVVTLISMHKHRSCNTRLLSVFVERMEVSLGDRYPGSRATQPARHRWRRPLRSKARASLRRTVLEGNWSRCVWLLVASGMQSVSTIVTTNDHLLCDMISYKYIIIHPYSSCLSFLGVSAHTCIRTYRGVETDQTHDVPNQTACPPRREVSRRLARRSRRKASVAWTCGLHWVPILGRRRREIGRQLEDAGRFGSRRG